MFGCWILNICLCACNFLLILLFLATVEIFSQFRDPQWLPFFQNRNQNCFDLCSVFSLVTCGLGKPFWRNLRNPQGLLEFEPLFHQPCVFRWMIKELKISISGWAKRVYRHVILRKEGNEDPFTVLPPKNDVKSRLLRHKNIHELSMGSKALILRQTARGTEGSEQSWWFWLVRMGVIQVWVPSWSDCSGLTFGLRVAARKRYISSHRSIDSIGGKCPNMVTWCKQISFLFVFTRPSQFSPSDLVNSLKRYSNLPYRTHPVRVDFHLQYLLVSWDLITTFWIGSNRYCRCFPTVESTFSQMESYGIVWNLIFL